MAQPINMVAIIMAERPTRILFFILVIFVKLVKHYLNETSLLDLPYNAGAVYHRSSKDLLALRLLLNCSVDWNS